MILRRSTVGVNSSGKYTLWTHFANPLQKFKRKATTLFSINLKISKSLIRKTSEFPKIYVYNFPSPSAETLFSVWTHRRVQSVRFTFEDPFDIWFPFWFVGGLFFFKPYKSFVNVQNCRVSVVFVTLWNLLFSIRQRSSQWKRSLSENK